MKTNKILMFLVGLIVFSSCQDMFTPADENTRQEDAMYTESAYAHGLLIYGYSRLPYLNTTTTDVATDDAVTNLKTSAYLNMAKGTWASDNDPMSQWNNCKDGIQYVNKFLTIVEKTEWAPSAESRQRMFIDRMKGESFGLRAIFYYYLLQAHGGYADDNVLYGVPLLTKPEDASSEFNQPRATFAECIQQIFNDCDSAMFYLPMDYKEISANNDIPQKYLDLGAEFSGYNLVFGQKARNLLSGRVAQAVKAQAALLAASPAFRDQSGVTPEDAANYCAAVLSFNNAAIDETGHIGIDMTGHVDWYSYTYKNMIDATVPEVLWRADRATNNNLEREQFPPSLFGSGRVNPSQNLVDAFPMNNGLPITDPDSGYDPQNPYANRDMRLANTVIYNGMKFKNGNILTGVDMVYGTGETDDNLMSMEKSTQTGYYLKKTLREDCSANPSSQLTQKHIYPRIRYTEMYLAYAEAANEAWGPTGDPMHYGFTAYSIIKTIRERAGIGKDEFGRDLPGGDRYIDKCKDSKELMRDLIRNERRLELCFENKRFWDLRRWLLPLNEGIKGMKVEKIDPEDPNSPLKYTVFDVEDRVFDNSYQCYGPIPKAEILKWSNLKQNKGWK